MSRRRTRFLATNIRTANGHPGPDSFILAYTEADAYAVLAYNRLMGTVEPFQRTVQTNEPFKINAAALKEAQKFLGLKLPVKVRFTSRVGKTNGNYRLGGTKFGGPNYHNIMLKSYLSPEQASKTLWHELAHAMQAEREAKDAGLELTDTRAQRAWATCDARGRGVTYRNKPIEVEAREHEALSETVPLTRPA